MLGSQRAPEAGGGPDKGGKSPYIADASIMKTARIVASVQYYLEK